MKRTGEVILGILGALVYGLFAALGAGMIWLRNNQDTIRNLLIEGGFEQEFPEITIEEVTHLFNDIKGAGLLLLITSIVAILLGIVAMILLRGNKNPKAAGIIFIGTTVAVMIVNFGLGIIGGIFYLIAGIMCLVRKPPLTKEKEQQPEDPLTVDEK
ncbi:DUF4064 domain-containing protein [Virgibacillus sp. C22-A2]|uniref:DUF4064 domain-containing protein n=1 Tax=Virgibacillus tibetensis TaxID=3042313 RepID=A0ABU6KGX9_9BACI|nr:DUF4064 domain-containing protein [Virgibacillus sp. C22-A2]